MERPATWKLITVGAALTGLGIVGAGAASAATPASGWSADIGVVSTELPYGTVVALDDDWTETYWDDQSAGRHWGGDDWTETYWDD